MITSDRIRPPSVLDVLGHAYKDWLHLNIFAPAAGLVGLVNVSLHGDPDAASSLAVGAALMGDVAGGWTSHVGVVGQGEAVVSANGLAAGGIGIEVDPATGEVDATVNVPGVELQLTSRPNSQPIDISDPSPFGSGWIAWRAVPRLSLRGSVRVGGVAIDLNDAGSYHDHNWGRWYWGDDAGWEWGTFHGLDATTFTLAKTTTRDHGTGAAALWITDASQTHLLAGDGVSVSFEDMASRPLVRVPGAMAALHSGRAQPLLPGRVIVEANDGFDRVSLEFEVAHACQIIAAEPTRPGWGFIHELVGTFSATTTIGGRVRRCEGLGVFEYVD